MKTITFIILVATLAITACGGGTETKNNTNTSTANSISDWQQRALEDSIIPWEQDDIEWIPRRDLKIKIIGLLYSRVKVDYVPDSPDYWKTYAEVVADDYAGDCEDISAYWYEVIRRERIVPDHALFMQFGTLHDGTGHVILVIDHPDGEIVVNENSIYPYDDISFQDSYFSSIIAEYNMFMSFVN